MSTRVSQTLRAGHIPEEELEKAINEELVPVLRTLRARFNETMGDAAEESRAVPLLLDSTGGTSSLVLNATADPTTNNNFATIATALELLILALRDAGILQEP